MAIVEIIVSGKFIVALFIYGVSVALLYPFMDRIYDRLEHPLLQWNWDHIAMPLFEVALMVLFIILAYPVIFGVQDAPSIISLFSKDELRINYLVNLLFIISLLFPLIPIIGNWHELILPLQGIAASMMIFSWFTASESFADYSFWPGWEVIIYCIILGIITHWLAIKIALLIGNKLDQKFNVLDSGELFARGLVLIMQSPVILIYSAGLGRQLI